MNLPLANRAQLGIRPMNWAGLTHRFLNEGELEALIALAKSVKPRAVLEFGVNVGRTAKALLANVPGIQSYQGIDVPKGYVTAKPVQRAEVPDRPGEMVEGDSRFELILRPRGSMDLAAADLKPCDVAFIDGDHGRAAVEHDTALARALVRPGGIIIWHDYHDLGNVDVREVLDEISAGGAAIFRVAGTWVAFERIHG